MRLRLLPAEEDGEPLFAGAAEMAVFVSLALLLLPASAFPAAPDAAAAAAAAAAPGAAAAAAAVTPFADSPTDAEAAPAALPDAALAAPSSVVDDDGDDGSAEDDVGAGAIVGGAVVSAEPLFATEAEAEDEASPVPPAAAAAVANPWAAASVADVPVAVADVVAPCDKVADTGVTATAIRPEVISNRRLLSCDSSPVLSLTIAAADDAIMVGRDDEDDEDEDEETAAPTLAVSVRASLTHVTKLLTTEVNLSDMVAERNARRINVCAKCCSTLTAALITESSIRGAFGCMDICVSCPA